MIIQEKKQIRCAVVYDKAALSVVELERICGEHREEMSVVDPVTKKFRFPKVGDCIGGFGDWQFIMFIGTPDECNEYIKNAKPNPPNTISKKQVIRTYRPVNNQSSQ